MLNPALLLLMTFAASPAAASSIERLSTGVVTQPASIVSLDCLDCTPVSEPKHQDAAPLHLPPGEQILSVEQRNGKPVLLRTEAWMGGSPVTFVSVNPVWIDREEQAIVLRSAPRPSADVIDGSTTSALPAAADAASPPIAPDFSGVTLRPSH